MLIEVLVVVMMVDVMNVMVVTPQLLLVSDAEHGLLLQRQARARREAAGRRRRRDRHLRRRVQVRGQRHRHRVLVVADGRLPIRVMLVLRRLRRRHRRRPASAGRRNSGTLRCRRMPVSFPVVPRSGVGIVDLKKIRVSFVNGPKQISFLRPSSHPIHRRTEHLTEVVAQVVER